MVCQWEYRRLKHLITGEKLPVMIVDLDCLDGNISNIANIAGKYSKNIRIATKSIRVPDLIRYIQSKGGDLFKGLMCYSVDEAQFLATLGFDDLLIAYPTCSIEDVEKFFTLTQAGQRVILMVDSSDHVKLIESVWSKFGIENTFKARLCIDVDMSLKMAGQHLGVLRSPIHTIEDFKELFKDIRENNLLELAGVMGYEAQVAGMGECNPYSPVLNPVKKFIKYLSVKDVYKKRKTIHQFLETEKCKISFFNGGGSGSLLSTSREPWITEVTVGSAFLQSHIFDYYKNNLNLPAFCFALQVDRIPQTGYYTCKSGGFIASGETSPDKSPLPFLPAGMKTVGTEGFGEVQTPLRYTGDEKIHLGDPAFFRPAKAGEIAEHFREYILVRGDKIVDRVPTYRGLDLCFY